MLSSSDSTSPTARPGKPIQLFRKKEGGNRNDTIEIIPEALRILENIRGPIAVMSVVGTMRQGKSYLLSRIVGRQKAFELGPTTNPQTFGIWTWDTPYTVNIGGQKVTLILLDTEDTLEHLSLIQANLQPRSRSAPGNRGMVFPLNILEKLKTWLIYVGVNFRDTKIFLISLLLSSLFVYNTRGVIDRSAIQKLRIMLDLNELIQSGSDTSKISNSQNNSATLSEYLPQFLWVIRDFTLKFPEGITTAKEYMIQSLTTELNTGAPKNLSSRKRAELEESDEIKSMIVSSFSNIDCHTMPFPISNPEAVGFPDIPSAMQALDTIPYEKLSKQFLQSMEEFNGKAFSMLPLKRFKDGSLMNGYSFSQLLQVYTDQINNSACVRILDAYQSVVNSVTNKSLESAVAMYRMRMHQLLDVHGQKPISDEILAAIHAQCFDQALETLHNNILGTKEQVEDAHKRFKEQIVTEDTNQLVTRKCIFGEFYWKNSDMITQENFSLIERLWTELIVSRMTGSTEKVFATHQQYVQAIEDFKSQYYLHCIPGRQASEIFINYSKRIEENKYHMNAWLKQKGLFEASLSRLQEEKLKAQKEASDLQAQNVKLYESMERIENEQQSFISRLEKRLKQMDKEANELRQEQKSQIKSQRKALQRIKNQELAEAKSTQETRLERQNELRLNEHRKNQEELYVRQQQLDVHREQRKSVLQIVKNGAAKLGSKIVKFFIRSK
ncbi:hypothetical protein K7432_010564 [Basidiobolus ranarum]|uniref:GB1/RHD3-type G domain-containing protein n=1 Tax=Basidiobolus ranarum TaxID=34480 RepID=A0ABR2WNI0_9FUNG